MHPRETTADLPHDELALRLRRLDSVSRDVSPGFDYHGLLARQAAGQARAQRRRGLLQASASVLVLAMVTLSAWRLAPHEEAAPPVAEPDVPLVQPRLVRANTYLALAAIEDHIATIDDALSDARLLAPRGAEVARLERTRADLLDSYTRVRYAEMVSNNF
jgi:hypothetical protein